ncbi:MAG: tetratricopeptide repeat protein [Methylococcaceae bacterium]|jgi:stress response protein SCP2/tetratricopeptide (TPR) repeat protein
MKKTDQTNANREIRVFISSTFRDMHAERDYLVSHVFPVIRRACRERQVEFTEIDLRWGVTKEDAEQGKVVRICLEEINRCRPYFLSLLGERYGWAPLDTDLDHKAELLALFPFLENSLKEGLSVTEMEILHGVMDNPDMTGHCFFYLRDAALTQTLADSLSAVTDYFETEQRLQDKLAALKDKVRNCGLPLRDNYASIEALGDLIKQDLLAVLDRKFPADLTPTPLEAEQNAHRSYANDRCKAYIANPRDTEALDAHLNTKTNNALLVTGESGLGKSALLAYWVNQQRLVNPDRFIIEHYVGISGDADPVAIIRRIMAEIKQRTDDSAELPSKPEDIIQDFPLWLAKVGERDPLLLIIDGLNQLESKEGQWLPGFWQENVKAIFSVIPGEQLEILSQREWPIHTLEALDLNRREQLIRDWLASYRKALSTEQTLRIAQASQTGNPLFLKTVLEELRIFGYFEHLDQRIATLLTANNPQELFVLVLERLENDFGKEIVTHIMQALWAARRGLSETEIAGITGLSRLVISTFLMAIDAHLAKLGGLLNFFHDYLRQAVKQHCLENKETETHAHIKLAQYFEQQELNNRVAEELPWQWQQAEQWEALKDCISAIPMFEVLYEKDEYELLGYWQSLIDRHDAGDSYVFAVEQWLQISDSEKTNQSNILNNIGLFLYLDCARYDASETILRTALCISYEIYGAEAIENTYILNNLARTLKAKGMYEESESLNRKNISIREKFLGSENELTVSSLINLADLLQIKGEYSEAESLLREALAIDEKLLGSEHPDISTPLNNLGLLLTELEEYSEAEAMLRKAVYIDEKYLGLDHPSTSVSLNNLGLLLNNQHKFEDAEVFFSRALVIREHTFGSWHPKTATSLQNLAGIFEKQGKYLEAELYYRRALEINEYVFGYENQDLIYIINNLAWLLYNQGHYSKSKALYQRALAICEHTIGSEHRKTALTLNNLALVLKAEKDYYGAEKYCRRALNIYENKLNHETKSTADIISNLAGILSFQGLTTETEMLYRRALVIREKVLGAEHADTASNLNNLAGLLSHLGHYDEAEPLYRRALAIRGKVLGAEHAKTKIIQENLEILLNDPLNNRELLWKQPDFITATGYAKAITDLSGQSNLTLVSLLLGANIANSNEQLEKPIEELTKCKSSIQEDEIKLGISSDKKITPIFDRSIPMDDELKSLLQEYRKSTLECLVDALIDQLHYRIEEDHMNILKGQRLSLNAICPNSFQINLQILGSRQPIDFACFGVDAQQKLSDELYMTFFNQSKTPCGGVELLHSDTFTAQFKCDLDKLPLTIDRLVFIAAIDGTETMGQIQNGYLSFIDSGNEKARFTLTGNDLKQEKALILGDIYRKDGAWRFNAIAQGFDGGMTALVKHFGGEVAVDISAPTPELIPAVNSSVQTNNSSTPSKSKSNIETMNDYLLTLGVTKGLSEDEEDLSTLSSPNIDIEINDDVWIFKLSYTPSTTINSGAITINYKLKHAFKIGSTQHFFITTLGAKMNNKLRVGGFWLDMDNGDFSYNAGFIVPPNSLTIQSIQENYDYCMAVIETYSPIMKRFVLSSKEDNDVGDYAGALEELEHLG